MRKIHLIFSIFSMFTLCIASTSSFASDDDAYGCETMDKTPYGVPVASLVVYKDSSVGQKLSVMLGDNLPTTYICTKTEGQIDGANYALYSCLNSIENKRAIFSVDKDNLDAKLELEANDQSYEMICELNFVIH